MDINAFLNKLGQIGNWQIVENLQAIGSLYAEILISLAIASILGLLIGLMMRRSVHKKILRRSDHDWAKMYSSLEKSSQADISNLEFKLESIAHDIRTLQATNRTLMTVLEKEELSAQQVSLQTIELNRQHVESQERLHVAMQRKDEEIKRLSDRVDEQLRDNLRTRRQSAVHDRITEIDVSQDETVAISPDQLTSELMDATVQITITNPTFSANSANLSDTGSADLDATYSDFSHPSDSDEFQNDATMAIDKGALAFFRRRRKD